MISWRRELTDHRKQAAFRVAAVSVDWRGVASSATLLARSFTRLKTCFVEALGHLHDATSTRNMVQRIWTTPLESDNVMMEDSKKKQILRFLG